MSNANAPIIIKRIVEEGGHGHHGGAWKVAYADFVTAMMAFFLMLWLLSTSSEETLRGLAEYFSESDANSGEPGGVGGMMEGTSMLTDKIIVNAPSSPFSTMASLPPSSTEEDADAFEMDLSTGAADLEANLEGMSEAALAAQQEQVEEQQFETAKAAIVNALQSTSELAEFASSLMIDQTPDGLRIQIVDQAQTAMFPGGSAAMFGHTKKLIDVVVKAIDGLPNKVSIRGHTDSRPFVAGSGRDNWTLSTERANATRLAMVEAGLAPKRLAEVIGKADSEPLLEESPDDPRNRRISVVLMRTGHARPDGARQGGSAGHAPADDALGAELPAGSDPFGAGSAGRAGAHGGAGAGSGTAGGGH